MSKELKEYLKKAEDFIENMPTPVISHYEGRGIVMLAGGVKYGFNAYANLKLLRHLGVTLPVEVWYLNDSEMFLNIKSLLLSIDNVSLVNAEYIRRIIPANIRGGWELKTYAILNTRFKEVLFLDADNFSYKNPEFLFDTDSFKEHKAIYWPDFQCIADNAKIWDVAGIDKESNCREWETGQIVIDKVAHWKPLQLAMHYNENSDYYYRFVHGDKATFQTAYQKLKFNKFMIPHSVVDINHHTMLQHDIDGSPLFYHRNRCKLSLVGRNENTDGFIHHDTVMNFANEFSKAYYTKLMTGIWRYGLDESDYRLMEFNSDGTIGIGAMMLEKKWYIYAGVLFIDGEYERSTCSLIQNGVDKWEGRWNICEKRRVTLTRVQ